MNKVTFYNKEKDFNEVFKLQSATIVVTTACNLKCSYCFEEHETKLIKPTALVRLIDLLYSNHRLHYGEEKPLSLSFFGGEPLLAWKSIVAMYERIREQGYKIETGITTNLTLLTDEMLELIDEEQIGLLVSIDGHKHIHDRNRDGSYDIVAQNVQKLIDADCGHLLEARMTVLPQDFKEMASGVASLFNLGFDNISCVPVTDQSWNHQSAEDFTQASDDLFAWVLNHYRNPETKRNLSVSLVDQNLYVNTAEDADLELIPCTMGGIKWIAISPDGSIYPCHQVPSRKAIQEELYLGNIFTNQIKTENLLGEISPAFTNKKTERFDCSSCLARVTCRGSCPAENLAETGYLGVPTDAWCQQTLILNAITKKYQKEILDAPNVRNHVINKLKANLEIMRQMDEILKMPKDDPLYLSKITKVYGVLSGNEGLLLEAFRNYFLNKIDHLLYETDQNLRKVLNEGVREV